MSVYLVMALALLVAVLFLVLRPFLLATVEAVPVPPAPADQAERTRAERVARTSPPEPQPALVAEAATGTPEVAAPAPVATAAPPGTSEPTDVRARVEAAIAARKAALRHRQCPSCQGTIEEGDAFCRSCGTRVAE